MKNRLIWSLFLFLSVIVFSGCPADESGQSEEEDAAEVEKNGDPGDAAPDT